MPGPKYKSAILIALCLMAACFACGDSDSRSSIPDNPARSQYVDNPYFKEYANSQFSFFYDQEMDIQEDSFLFIPMVLAGSEHAIIFGAVAPPKILLYFLSEIEVLDLMTSTFKEIIEEVIGSEHSVFLDGPRYECHRMIGGKSVMGYEQALEVRGIAFAAEFYAYNNGNRAICCIFVAADENRDLAERYFEVITDSIQ
jgi:hypothetical protein